MIPLDVSTAAMQSIPICSDLWYILNSCDEGFIDDDEGAPWPERFLAEEAKEQIRTLLEIIEITSNHIVKNYIDQELGNDATTD